MSSIPSFQPHPQERELRNRIISLETENQQLRARLQWEKQLIANPHLSPAQKLALLVTAPALQLEGYTHVNITYVAKQIGMSPKITGKNLQAVADANGLTRKAETIILDTGEQQTRVYFAPTEKTHRPSLIAPQTPRNHGGKRVRCHDCGSDNLVERKTIICLDCGATQSQIIRLVNSSDPQLDPKDDHVPDTSYNHDAPGTITVHDHDVHDNVHHNVHDTRISDDDVDHDHTHHADHNAHASITIHDHEHTHHALDHTLIITPPMDNLTPQKNQKEPTDNLTPGIEKPSTPPKGAPAILSGQEMKEQIPPPNQEAEERREQTVKLLLAIAGDAKEHISMPGESGKKYTTIHRSLTARDIQAHLAGSKTVGATLHHTDGTTRALCFDVDDTPTDNVTWQQLKSQAALLIACGFTPLLEPSPAGRGGHLWLIFTERVNARAALSEVCQIAPVLKEIAEYWPGRGNQKVRLPAGKYVTPDFSSWTHIVDANGAEIKTGDLIDQQTPASLIPALPPDEGESEPAAEASHQAGNRRDEATIPDRPTTPDVTHRRKYKDHAMWVEWPSEQYLIDRFNAQYTIDELATRERNGMINASLIGRPERTASVAVTRDGQRFTDFGAGARGEDGAQDGGDPFEFYIRSQNLTKSEALRQLGRGLNRAASAEILRAARAGELPPAWVMEIITPVGQAVYNQNATKHNHKTLEDHTTGGVGGFSQPEQMVSSEQAHKQGGQRMDWREQQTAQQETPALAQTGGMESGKKAPSVPQAETSATVEQAQYPPPERACLVCGQNAWVWRGERYECGSGSPEHEERQRQDWIWTKSSPQ